MDGQECLPKFFGPLSVVKSGSGRFNKAIITTIAWWNFSIDVRVSFLGHVTLRKHEPTGEGLTHLSLLDITFKIRTGKI